MPVWVPIPIQELGSEAEWSREEKVSKVAEMLKHQQERHCFIKLDTENTQPLKIPFVRDYSQSSEYLLEYEKAVYQTQGAIAGPEVDNLLTQNEDRFLAVASDRKLLDRSSNVMAGGLAPVTQSKKLIAHKTSARSELFSKIKTKDIFRDD